MAIKKQPLKYLGNNNGSVKTTTDPANALPYGLPYNIPSSTGTRYNRFNRTTSLALPYGFDMQLSDTDMLYNLGSAIGALWGANYNKRGAEKATNEANELINKYGQSANNGLYDKAIAAGVVGDNTDAQAMIRQEKLANKYPEGGDPNPDTTSRVASKDTEQLNQRLSAIDIASLPNGGYDKNALKSQIVSELRQKGRNDWQIQQALTNVAPTITAGEQQYNNIVSDRLYNQYKDFMANQDYEGAGMAISQLAKTNPQLANVLGMQYGTMYKLYANDIGARQQVQNYMDRLGVDEQTGWQLYYKYNPATGVIGSTGTKGTGAKGTGEKKAKGLTLSDAQKLRDSILENPDLYPEGALADTEAAIKELTSAQLADYHTQTESEAKKEISQMYLFDGYSPEDISTAIATQYWKTNPNLAYNLQEHLKSIQNNSDTSTFKRVSNGDNKKVVSNTVQPELSEEEKLNRDLQKASSLGKSIGNAYWNNPNKRGVK